jgi:ATP-binding cassette, subfamily B, multidrug efflux pump
VSGEQSLGKAYDLRLMKQLWRFVRPHGRLVLLTALLIPITISFELVQPILLKIAIQEHIAIGKVDGLETLAAMFVGVVLLQALSSFAEQWALQLLGQRSMNDLRLAIYDHVLRQRAAFFDRMPVGRLMTRMTNDIESINEMFASGVVTLFADVAKMTFIVCTMLYYDVQLTLMTFLTVPLLIIVVNYARNAMRSSFRAIRVRIAAMNAFLQEHLSGIRVVQIMRRETTAAREYNEINAGHRDAYLGSIRADAVMYALVEAIGVIGTALVAWWMARQLGVLQGNEETVGLFVMFLQYIEKFFIPVRDLSAKYAVMQSAMAATERIVELLNTDEPDAPPRATPAPAVTAAPLVAFDDVHFSYGAEKVLGGVSFDIVRGQTIAVVGATGSGKSTLIKLLTRLYEVDRGAIRLGGKDIRDVPVDELRRRITVVSQDVFLFTGTVAENVGLELDVDRQVVLDAVRRVGADRRLARRAPPGSPPDAWVDGPVAERGNNFSAGERQLLSFARALVRDPEILILDEATAHVDPEAEELIEKGVAELMRGRTTLVIAHRLSTIRNADLILVMDHGVIVERGTHAELVAADGVYAALERTFRRAAAA